MAHRSRIERECQRLTQAIALGGDLDALVEASPAWTVGSWSAP